MSRLRSHNAEILNSSHTRLSGAIGCFLLLSACAVATPPRINERLGQPVQLTSIELLDTTDNGDVRTGFAKELRAALKNQGIKLGAGAPYIGDYAIGTRGARTTISSIGEEKNPDGSDSAGQFESTRRTVKLLDGCKTKRIRATFVLFERATGSLVYRGAAESDICESEPIRAGRLAKSLARDLAKFQQQEK